MPGVAYDVIFVGAGLSGGLAAFRLRQIQPQLRILLIDEARRRDHEQTWSFQGLAEIPRSPWARALYQPQTSWLAPLLSQSWSASDVRFPARKRRLSLSYHSIRYHDFRTKLEELFGDDFRFARVQRLEAGTVYLEDGTVARAACVVDARGWGQVRTEYAGYQKFVGLNIELEAPHGLHYPVIMDACIPQTDGYRFIYVLPWTATTLLVEDTHYSDDAHIDTQAYLREIRSYVQAQGWRIKAELSQEQGALPIPLWGQELATDTAEVPCIGARAGLFHAVTGYSLYEAVSMAEWFAAQNVAHSASLATACARRARAIWREQGFLRRLNNMLFYAAEPASRYRVLQRFYGHSEALIARFFMGSLYWRDKLRILSGKPPVPLLKGLYYFFHKFGVKHGTAPRLTAAKNPP